MLVICEDCAKKYNIDESRIKGNRARFTCNECGHIIIVDKADLMRPLLRSASQQPSRSPSIDLLKEMEAPLPSDLNPKTESSNQTDKSDGLDANQSAALKRGGLTFKSYFLIAGFLSFCITNAGIGYIMVQHYSKIGRQPMELHSSLLITSILVLLGTWAVSFLILFGMGAYLSRTVNSMTAILNRIDQGEKGVELVAKGPRELKNMAQILSSLSSKII